MHSFKTIIVNKIGVIQFVISQGAFEKMKKFDS